MANTDFTLSSLTINKSSPPTSEPDWDNMDEDEFADKILAKMENQCSILTCDEMDIIEKFWEQDRRARRCALIQLTKPFKWLRENVENDDEYAEAAVEILECIDPKKYEEIAKLISAAKVRVMCALAGREDMQILMDKAKTREENHD